MTTTANDPEYARGLKSLDAFLEAFYGRKAAMRDSGSLPVVLDPLKTALQAKKYQNSERAAGRIVTTREAIDHCWPSESGLSEVRAAHLRETLARVPQPSAVLHYDSVSNILLDLAVSRAELLGLLPLVAGGFQVSVDLRDRVVFRRLEPRS